MIIYYGFLVTVFGLVLGSFLNCMAMRIVRNEDFVKGRSHCMHCGTELTGRDLIPVVSYLSTGGKCRYCKQKISARYPASEILFAALSLGLYVKEIAFYSYPDTLQIIHFFRDWFFTGCLFSLSVSDFEEYEIPDGILIAGAIVWVITAPFVFTPFIHVPEFVAPGWQQALYHVLAGVITGAVILIFSLIMDRVLKKESMGGGDVKLYALCGLYLGGFLSYANVLFSAIFGLLLGAILKVVAKTKEARIPLGPAIALSAYVLLLFGEELKQLYVTYTFI